jgi:hypothetical protein
MNAHFSRTCPAWPGTTDVVAPAAATSVARDKRGNGRQAIFIKGTFLWLQTEQARFPA